LRDGALLIFIVPVILKCHHAQKKSLI